MTSRYRIHLQAKYNISVIIPNYNRSNDLLRAVNSVLNQTFPVLEVLVCDDGSTDDSKQKIASLNSPKVKWLDCGKNGGPAIPRNKGIKESKGNWIAFLDNDDEWVPVKIARQVEVLESAGVKAVCSNASRIRNGVNMGDYSTFDKTIITFSDLTLCNYIICSSVMVEKKLIMETAVFPEQKSMIAIEDFSLWLKLSTKTDFAYIREALIKYSDESATSIRTAHSNSWIIFEIIVKDFKNWMKGNGIQLSRENQESLDTLVFNIKQNKPPNLFQAAARKLKRYLP